MFCYIAKTFKKFIEHLYFTTVNYVFFLLVTFVFIFISAQLLKVLVSRKSQKHASFAAILAFYVRSRLERETIFFTKCPR